MNPEKYEYTVSIGFLTFFATFLHLSPSYDKSDLVICWFLGVSDPDSRRCSLRELSDETDSVSRLGAGSSHTFLPPTHLQSHSIVPGAVHQLGAAVHFSPHQWSKSDSRLISFAFSVKAAPYLHVNAQLLLRCLGARM